MAGLNPNAVDDATDPIDATVVTTTSTNVDSTSNAVMLNIQDGMNYIREVAVQKKNMMKSSQLECMIQFHTFIIDKYLLFSFFHNFSSINNDNNNDNNTDDDDETHATHKGIEQLLSMKILSQLQSNNNNVNIITTNTSTTTTSPLHITPISTTTITGAINLSIDSIRSSLISFQKLQYIVITTSQKLLFAICFSYGYLVWNIFNYNNTFIITNSNRNDDDSNKNAGNNNHKYNSSIIYSYTRRNSNTYFNEKKLVDDDISHHNHLNFNYHQQQYQQIISLSLIEIMETLFYFFKYSKLKIKLQAVQILLFIATKFIEINASNNNVDNNSGVRVDDIKDNNDDFDDKIIRFFFYSQEFFISFLLR